MRSDLLSWSSLLWERYFSDFEGGDLLITSGQFLAFPQLWPIFWTPFFFNIFLPHYSIFSTLLATDYLHFTNMFTSWTLCSYSFICLWVHFSSFGHYLYLEDSYSSFNTQLKYTLWVY